MASFGSTLLGLLKKMKKISGYYCSECGLHVDDFPERMAGLCFNCTILVWDKDLLKELSPGGIFFNVPDYY